MSLFASVTVDQKTVRLEGELVWPLTHPQLLKRFQLNGCHLLKVPQPSQIELTAIQPQLTNFKHMNV